MIVSRDTLRLLIKPDAEVSVACNHVSYGRVYFLSVTSCTCVSLSIKRFWGKGERWKRKRERGDAVKLSFLFSPSPLPHRKAWYSGYTCVDYRGRTRACTSCAFFVLARKHQLFLPVSGFPFFPVDVHSLSFSAQTEQNMRLGATNIERSTETLLIQSSSTICYLFPFMSTFCDLVSYTNHLFYAFLRLTYYFF